MKKTISFVLSLVLIISVMGVGAFADETDYVAYTVDSNFENRVDYTTLAEAIENVPDGGYIYLVADVTESIKSFTNVTILNDSENGVTINNTYIDYPVDFDNVSKMWEKSVSEFGDLPAIVDGASVTYSELDKMVASLRGVLVNKGIKAGDNVGIFMPNSLAFVATYLAVTTLGAVAVLMPPHLDEMTVFGCTLKFALKSVVYAKALEDKTVIIPAKNPNVILISDEEKGEESAPAVYVEPTAPCTVLFTGGTTGRSKGALLSQRAVMRGTKNGCYGIKDVFNQKYLLVLPLTHVFGLIRNLLTNLMSGSTLFICRNNKDMFRDIAIFKPTIMVMVPALAEMALNLSKQFGRNMLGEDMKTIICGAANVPPYLSREYKKIGVTLLPGYGLTESANLVSGNPEVEKKPDSVGFMYDGMEYKIVDGELWLKGDNMLDCYVGEPEENALAFEDGYFKTGDLVRMDEEGFLYITGRKKEVIVLPSGENVSPAEVEAKFSVIDAIQDCLVYLEGNFLTLEVLPRATVIKALGIENVEEYLKEQINKVNQSLTSFMRISKIKIRDTDFKRSPSMKIIRGQN